MPRLARFLATGVLLAASLTLASCSSALTSQPGATAFIVNYTCCTAADITAIRHPGETFKLHWTAAPATPDRGSVTKVTLRAGLDGPYASPTDVKSSTTGPKWKAPDIVTTNAVGTHPVSVITIPKDAVPGYYNLSASVVTSFTDDTTGSIIQIRVK